MAWGAEERQVRSGWARVLSASPSLHAPSPPAHRGPGTTPTGGPALRSSGPVPRAGPGTVGATADVQTQALSPECLQST